jgi:hypothetical protein
LQHEHSRSAFIEAEASAYDGRTDPRTGQAAPIGFCVAGRRAQPRADRGAGGGEGA